MYNPTEFLRAAIPAAVEAGKAIMEIYARPTEDMGSGKKKRQFTFDAGRPQG